MLVLTRKVGEAITVDGPCELIVRQCKTGSVSIAIKADRSVRIVRSELLKAAETESS